LPDFVFGQDCGDVGVFLARKALMEGSTSLFVEDVTVEEGTEGLISGRGGDVLFDSQMGDEGLDLIGAHVFGVAFIMKEDVAFDPVLAGLFGAVGVVFGADGVAHLIEQFAGRGFDGRGLHFGDCPHLK
jgi:hypothetical protein